jgi:hypothetical protein
MDIIIDSRLALRTSIGCLYLSAEETVYAYIQGRSYKSHDQEYDKGYVRNAFSTLFEAFFAVIFRNRFHVVTFLLLLIKKDASSLLRLTISVLRKFSRRMLWEKAWK